MWKFLLERQGGKGKDGALTPDPRPADGSSTEVFLRLPLFGPLSPCCIPEAAVAKGGTGQVALGGHLWPLPNPSRDSGIQTSHKPKNNFVTVPATLPWTRSLESLT